MTDKTHKPTDIDVVVEGGAHEAAATGRMLLAALAYARRGWPVIPLHSPSPGGCTCLAGPLCKSPAKHPRTVHGIKDASTDETTVRSWWRCWPDANVGIITGPSSGLLAIDVDPRHGGDQSIARLDCPATVENLTGGGGKHLVFTYPRDSHQHGCSVGILPGVDVRGMGGVIVAPPSMHASGQAYSWHSDRHPEKMQPVEIPERLLKILTSDSYPGPAVIPAVGDTIPEGHRSAKLTSLAGTMRRRGLVEEEIAAALLVINQRRCDPPLHEREVEAIARSIARYEPEQVSRSAGKNGNDASTSDPSGTCGSQSGAESPGNRPTIAVRGELVPVCNEAVAALVADRSGSLYTRARMLVRVVDDSGHKVFGLCRPAGAPHIEVVGVDNLRERLDRAARWVSLKERDGVIEERPVLPPSWVARVLLDRGEWPFPPLEGVIEAPAMRADGSILDVAGYDPSSGLLYLPSAEFPLVPEAPSIEEMRAAVEVLLDPLVDFPFISESDRAAALAAILTVVARSAIAGPVPCFPVRAPTPGTGKSLLVDLISVIATARVAARMTVPRDDDEGRKRILGIGLEGAPIVLLDNIEGALGSPSLAAALTGTEFADRLLGVSKIVRVPIRAVWFATGNGLTFKGDLGRRVVPIDMDPKVEHPEDRLAFKYPDLLPHVRRERPRLLVAALTALRAFDQTGRPGHGKPKVGTFEEWDDLVRGAVMWLGLGDPVAGRERVREEGDADLDLIRAVYLSWYGAFGEAARTVAEAIAAATSEDESKRELRSALAALDLRGDGSRLNSRVVADRLKRWKGRVVEGLRLEKAGKHHQAVLWRIVPTGQSDHEGDGGGDADAGSHASEGSQLPVDLVFDLEDGGGSSESGESIPSHLDFESELSLKSARESGELGGSVSQGGVFSYPMCMRGRKSTRPGFDSLESHNSRLSPDDGDQVVLVVSQRLRKEAPDGR